MQDSFTFDIPEWSESHWACIFSRHTVQDCSWMANHSHMVVSVGALKMWLLTLDRSKCLTGPTASSFETGKCACPIGATTLKIDCKSTKVCGFHHTKSAPTTAFLSLSLVQSMVPTHVTPQEKRILRCLVLCMGAQRLQLVCRQGSVKVETCTSANSNFGRQQPASLLLNHCQQGIQSSKSFPALSKALSDCVWQIF